MRIKYREMIFWIPDGVYPPAEDSFLLAEAIKDARGDKAVDVGTGCGIQAIILSKNCKRVVATDIDSKCKAAVIINSILNNVSPPEFRLGDLYEPLEPDEKFDIIVFNPPYLKEEYKVSIPESRWWSGGKNGRAIVRRFIKGLRNFLSPDGEAYLVINDNPPLEGTLKMIREERLNRKVINEVKVAFDKIYVLRLSLDYTQCFP